MLKTAVFALLVFVLASATALAEEVAGPVQNGESAKQESTSGTVEKEAAEDPHAVFERIGIFVVRKGPANPSKDDAAEIIREYIAEGFHSEEELLEKVRKESPAVVARLIVDISRQRLFLVNNYSEILAEYKVSTGLPGYATPPGSYNIVNKAVYAYSKKYEADMYHWMGLTRNGDIGMHGLKGSGYERRLGRRASHGCIRLSREDARYLYSIMPVGMPVEIVPGLDEVVYYKPITDADLLQMIDEYLGAYQPLVVF